MEEFRDIIGYEGLYMVSNLGNVKSLSKKVCNHRGCYITKDIILKTAYNKKMYLQVKLYKNGESKTRSVHQLVAESFLNHVRCGMVLVVDHVNSIRDDNRVENLRVVTNRENSYRAQGNYTSKYKGVSWFVRDSKWKAMIYFNGKRKHLGYFTCELAAHLAYKNKLKELA